MSSPSEEGEPSRSLVSAFEEAKGDLIQLVKTRSDSLPQEYALCSVRARSTMSDIENAEKQLTHLRPADKRRYILSLLINETNQLLQNLHDSAEDRVIRGEVLTDSEVSFISEVTDLYYLLLKDLAPIFNPDMTASDVVTLEEDTVKSIQGAVLSGSRSTGKKHSAAVSSIVKDVGLLDRDLMLTEEEIEAFKTMYLQRVSEHLIRHGIVVQKKSFSQNLRYLFLTNSQLILTESIFLPKGTIDLSTVVKVLKPSKPNYFSIVAAKKTYSLYSKEAQEWVDDISKGREELDQVYTEKEAKESDSQPAEEEYEICVRVSEMEDLRTNRKGRPDNPYFFVGVGNPERFSQDRRNRHRSKVQENSRSPVFGGENEFLLMLSASREYLLDLRVYSNVRGARNDFSYGVVQIPLEEIFVKDNHVVEGWYDIFVGGETSVKGRARVHIELQNWRHNRMPPPRPVSLPAILSHRIFEVRERVPLVFGKNKEVVGVIKHQGSSNILMDTVSKRRIYTLTKSSFFKREYTISDDLGVFARCYHKMKSIRKKKLRMVLTNSELLFTMEGGCFDHKQYNNEVYIQNVSGSNVASLLLGEEEEEDGARTRLLILNVLEPNIDAPLLLMFGLYVLRTT